MFEFHLLQRSDRAHRAGELEDVHAGVGTVDDVDIATVVDFDIDGLDYAVAALNAGGVDPAFGRVPVGRRYVIADGASRVVFVLVPVR